MFINRDALADLVCSLGTGSGPGMLVPDLGSHLHCCMSFRLGRWGFRMFWGLPLMQSVQWRDAVMLLPLTGVSFVTLLRMLHVTVGTHHTVCLSSLCCLQWNILERHPLHSSCIRRTSKASAKLQRMPFEVAKSVCWLKKIYLPLQGCLEKCCWWGWLFALFVTGTKIASFVRKPHKCCLCPVSAGACSIQDLSPDHLQRRKSASLGTAESAKAILALAKPYLSASFLPVLMFCSCSKPRWQKSLPWEKKTLWGWQIAAKYKVFVTLSGQIQSRSNPGSLTGIWRQPLHALPRHEPVGFLFLIVNILNDI